MPGAACLPCGVGLYCPSDNMYSPKVCEAGYRCPAGNANIQRLECPGGHYSDAERLGACKACSKGKYSPTPGPGVAVTQCDVCEKGTYQDQDGKAECKPCLAKPGEYQDETGQTACKVCPAGYMNKVNPSTTVLRTSMLDACTICDPGSFNPTHGSGNCTLCPLGWYSDRAGSTACRQCDGNKTTAKPGARSASECFCPEDQFDPGTGKCTQCGR